MRTLPALSIVSVLLALGCSHSIDERTPGASASLVTGASPATPVVATPNAAPTAAKPEEIETIPPEPFSNAERMFASVKETLAKEYYDRGIIEADLYRAAVQGMLERVDPKMRKWNKLLPPSELAELHNDLKGEIVGVGVNLKFEPETGRSVVLASLPGSPAEKAGVLAGDEIVSIDGKTYKGQSLREVVRDIRGKAGDAVTFTVLRSDKLVAISMKRAVVGYDETMEMSLPDKIGYVRVRGFSEKTVAALKLAFEAMTKRGDRALILDLRDNHGGSFDAAVATAELFLPSGTGIVSVKRRDRTDVITSKATTTAIGATLPMAVLINHQTSSGAELLTTSLQEGRHAVVVGSRTLGKWTVQKLDELPNGYGIKYTVGLFLSPAGRSFEGVGLMPDVQVDMDEKTREAASLQKDPEKRLAIDTQLRTTAGILRARL